MQSASDIFLGWMRGRRGRDFYIRQLRDMKMSARIEEGATAQQTTLYAELCGRTLAHAHAKSGDAALISGYLGKSDDFDQAIGSFALAYADQNEQDHAALVAAVNAGTIQATEE
jgi:predicted alpha/beta hydrolase